MVTESGTAIHHDAFGARTETLHEDLELRYICFPKGSEDAAVQDVRSANNMNDATQPQHFTLRSGSSTSGSPASSRASSQSGFRVQAQSNNTRGSAPVPELAGELQFRAVTPEPASAQL